MDGLYEYRVHLHEEIGDSFILVFDCWAEDNEHAIDQAINSYPCGEIINAERLSQ
jgi:hypothetical protein